MGALVGFIFGYVVGTQAGPESLEKLRRAWLEIADSAEFKGLVATLTAYLENVLARGSGAVAEQLKTLMSGEGDLAEAWHTIGGSDDLAGAWMTIARSTEFQRLLAAGMSMVGGVVDQGTAIMGERLAAGRSVAAGH